MKFIKSCLGMIVGFIALCVIISIAGKDVADENGQIFDYDANPETNWISDIKKKKQPAKVKLGPAIEVEPLALYNSYQQNEIKADGIYKGKLISICGPVRSIKKDVFGKLFITIEAGNGMLQSIMCRFPSNAESVLSTLQFDQTVVVEGVCDGLMIYPIMNDCKILAK